MMFASEAQFAGFEFVNALQSIRPSLQVFAYKAGIGHHNLAPLLDVLCLSMFASQQTFRPGRSKTRRAFWQCSRQDAQLVSCIHRQQGVYSRDAQKHLFDSDVSHPALCVEPLSSLITC